MNYETFLGNLEVATARSVSIASTMVTTPLPNNPRYRVLLNCSYDGNPLVGDQELFEADSASRIRTFNSLADVGLYLYRKGKVPQWIDVSVEEADQKFTTIELTCCGRYTANSELFYHKAEGIPPFHVLGPAIPPGWESSAVHGKFPLGWRQQWRAHPKYHWWSAVRMIGKFYSFFGYRDLEDFASKKILQIPLMLCEKP